MAPMSRSMSVCIVHPDTEESPDFRILGDTQVECASPDQGNFIYDFDRVFAQRTTQEKVFQEVAKSPVLELLENFQSTVFLAFGATGSGKTFAVTGGAKRFADRGLIPRSISTLFEALGSRADRGDFQVSVSFYEIYKDYVVDLLAERRPRVAVQVNGNEAVLPGLLKPTAPDESTAYHLLFQGDSNRHFERYPANPETSRGHVFYILHLSHLPTGREASLSFIDLAAVISTRNTSTIMIKRGLDALKAAIAAMLAREEPLLDGQLLTQLLQPALQQSSTNVALICPVRYTDTTNREVHHWLEFSRQFHEALSMDNEEENGDENYPPEDNLAPQHPHEMHGHSSMTKDAPGTFQQQAQRPHLQEMNFEVPAMQESAPGHFHHNFVTQNGETVHGPYLSPVHAASDINHGSPLDSMQLQRDNYPYQPPVVEIATASELARQGIQYQVSGQSPQVGHAFAPTSAPPSTPLAPPSWSPLHGSGTTDVRTASEATLPPMPLHLMGESPNNVIAFDAASLTQDLNNGSFILAESEQACASSTFATAPATAFTIQSDVSGTGLHPVAQDTYQQLMPSGMIASHQEEAVRATRVPQLIAHASPVHHAPNEEAPTAVMRAPYLQPSTINPVVLGDDIGASSTQRAQEMTQIATTGSAGSATYPGTLIMPQAPTSQYIPSAMGTQTSLASGLVNQAPLGSAVGTQASMPPGSATAPVGTTPGVPASPLQQQVGSFVPKVPHAMASANAPVRSRTPPAPSRAPSSPQRSGTARVSVGPARSRNSGVTPLPRPASPLRSSSPLPPRSPSPLAHRTSSPLMQRSPSHSEMPSSGRANMYAPVGRPLSPHPHAGQQNIFPTGALPSSSSGMTWAVPVPWLGSEGVQVPQAPPFAGTPQRMTMVQTGPPRSLSPQQDRQALMHSPGHDAGRCLQYMQFRGHTSR